jgi:predicted AAA+ superfamily ATPase
MIESELEVTLQRLSGTFALVAIIGPRQSDKTTHVRALFPYKTHVSLEDSQEEIFALENPQMFLTRFNEGAIFDEDQRWPDLFYDLQVLVDEDSQHGAFVLTGFPHFGLFAGVS